MNNTRLSVSKHEGKIRLLIEWPVEGDDPDLMRRRHWDIPVVHALALAAAIVSEATALLRFPAKPARRALTVAPEAPSEQLDGAPRDREHAHQEGAREHDASELGVLGIRGEPVQQSAGNGEQHDDPRDHADSVAHDSAEKTNAPPVTVPTALEVAASDTNTGQLRMTSTGYQTNRTE